jgi:hypothetical protein
MNVSKEQAEVKRGIMNDQNSCAEEKWKNGKMEK